MAKIIVSLSANTVGLNLTLVVTKRSSDYHCTLQGTKLWDAGKTAAEAIGQWVLTHGADQGITVNTPKSKQSLE